jgi:hypothetical protein
MRTWRRANRPALSTLVGLVFTTVGIMTIILFTVLFISGSGRWKVDRTLGLLVVYGFLTVWTGFAWRMYRMGVYVSPRGVLISYLWRNRVIPWSEITGFATGQAMVLGVATVRQAIFVKRAGRGAVETPIQRRTPRSSVGLRKNAGPVLNEADFETTLARLRLYLAAQR